MSQIPGPKGHWLMGSFSEFQNDALGFLTRSAETYADIFRFRMGPIPIYVVNNPDYLHQIFVKDADKFYKASITKKAVYKLIGNGLVLSEGDFWKRQRKLAAPAFHVKRIASYADVMVNLTLDTLSGWDDGATRDIEQEMTALTLRIATKTLFDADTSGVALPVAEAMHVVQEVLAKRLRSPLAPPDWVPTPDNKRVSEAIATLDRVIADLIAERRASGEDRGDLLSMLLLARDDEGNGMSDQQLRDEVITLFVAGHETTAKLMAWIWYTLSENPEIEAQLIEEMDSALAGRTPTLHDLAQLPYNDMVVKEALRLYPPAWIISREPVEDVTLGSYTLKKGSTIFISPYLAHRNPDYFPDPERFIPERFAPGAEKQVPTHAYIPFGGGPRICIGNNFAIMEARLILATILQRYQLRVVPGHKVEVVPLLTLCPANGMPMQISQRVQELELA